MAIDEYGLVTKIIQIFANRKNLIQYYWDYYLGDQGKYLPPYTFETKMQFSDRIRASRPENHCKPICEQIPARLYGSETGDNVISRRVDDQATNEWIHEHIYEDSDNKAALYDMALETMVCGHSVCEFVLWDKYANEPYDFLSEFKPERIQMKLVVQNLRTTAPMPKPNFPGKLGALCRHYRKDNADPYYNMRSSPITGVQAKDVDVAEFIDDRYHFIWEKETDTNDWWRVPHDIGLGTPILFGQAMSEWRNPFGRIDNRFAIMRAPGDGVNLEGLSMLQQLIPLQDDINESRYDDMRILQLYDWPVGAFMGGTAPDNFQFGVDRYLEFPNPETSFEWIQPDVSLESSQDRKEKDRFAMNQVAGISEISRGNTMNIGQARSSAAFYVLFSPDILNVKKRLPRLIQFEKDLIRGCTRLWNVVTRGATLNPESDIEIMVPDDLMGRDKMLEAEGLQILRDTGLLDVFDYYKRMNPEKSDSEIMALIKKNMPPVPEPAAGGGKTGSSGGSK